MTSLNIAFLGVGSIAQQHALAALSLGHRIVAGSSLSHNSPRWKEFQKIAPDARFVSDFQLLMDDKSIDAFIVCLSWHAIPKWIKFLLAHPKPMLIEKPAHLFSDLLESAAESAGSLVSNKMIGMNRRFFKPVRELRRRVAEGGLKAVEITISESVDRLIKLYGREIGPHILPYSSCHILDVAQFILGPLRVIKVIGYEDSTYPMPFKSYNGLLAAGNNIPVTFALNSDDPVPIGLRLRFDDHTHWHLSPIELLSVFYGYQIIEPTVHCNVRRYSPLLQRQVAAETGMRPGISEQMEAFCKNDFREGASVSDFISILRLIDNIRDSDSGH